MFRKIIILCLLSLCFFQNVQAENSSILLSYKKEPSYHLSFPENLDISEETTSLTIEVSGDIYYDSYLYIETNPTLQIDNGLEKETVYVSLDKNIIEYEQLCNKTVPLTITLDHGNLKAGKYLGSLNIKIKLIQANEG